VSAIVPVTRDQREDAGPGMNDNVLGPCGWALRCAERRFALALALAVTFGLIGA
jgi:hypothetical protein